MIKEDLEILERFFNDCVGYWKRTGCDDKTAFRNALCWDIMEIFEYNGCLHDPYVPNGRELDIETTKEFIKTKEDEL